MADLVYEGRCEALGATFRLSVVNPTRARVIDGPARLPCPFRCSSDVHHPLTLRRPEAVPLPAGGAPVHWLDGLLVQVRRVGPGIEASVPALGWKTGSVGPVLDLTLLKADMQAWLGLNGSNPPGDHDRIAAHLRSMAEKRPHILSDQGQLVWAAALTRAAEAVEKGEYL